MRNLLRVNFLRWKNKLSTVYCLIGIICLSAINCVTVYTQKTIGGDTVCNLTVYPILMIAALLVTGAAVLLNRGEGDPIRNAVIAGYSKTKILLAELPPALVFACIASLIMLLPMLRAPSVLMRFPAAYILLGALGILLMFCLAAVLCVILSMNCTTRTVAIIGSAAVLLGGYFCTTPLCEALMEPQTIPVVQETFDKTEGRHLVKESSRLNPEYIAPPNRTRVTAITMMLPQTAVSLSAIYLDISIIPTDEYAIYEREELEWSRNQCESMMRMLPLCETGMMLLITALGLLRFRRTDMN